MKRKDALAHIRIAGYHGDKRGFMRIYTEHSISLEAANAEYIRGEEMKKNGVQCSCAQCKGGNK